MRILAIESSADESGVSLIEASGDLQADFAFTVLGNAVASQIALHAQYGGIFPAMAAREHQKNFVPLLETVLKEAGELKEGLINTEGLEAILSREQDLLSQLVPFLQKYTRPNVDAISVTYGPGLEPALWVGINFARALAHVWKLPIVPVNHMEGHLILSALSGQDQKYQVAGTTYQSKIQFPMLGLLISGGHTELVLSKEWMQYEILGQTRDDAVGEAFDKVARLMDLPYPGGPEISRLAAQARHNDGLTRSIILPRPMRDTDSYDFSFSGLKTAVRRIVEAHQSLSDALKEEIALEFENACTDVLIAKTLRAVEETGAQTVVVGGGVSANTHIREELKRVLDLSNPNVTLLIPPPKLATDNALMIALAGYLRALNNEFVEPEIMRANGNLKLV